MDYLPVFLRLRGQAGRRGRRRRGGARKVEWLLKAGARVTVIAPEVHAALRAARRCCGAHASRGRVRGRPISRGAVAVVAATDDRGVNAAVSAAARRAAYRSMSWTIRSSPRFIFPAIIDRSPLIVAVSSRRPRAGAGARACASRSRRCCRRDSVPSPASWAASQERAARARGARARRRVLGAHRRAAASARGCWQGQEAQAESGAATASCAPRSSPRRGGDGAALGEVYLIGAGPGDPDLLTLRAAAAAAAGGRHPLRPAGGARRCWIARGATRSGSSSARSPASAASRSASTTCSWSWPRRGKRVARLKGGDPFVFGRGGEEIEVLQAHGIPYTVVPGITAALGAAAASGLPLTHRRLAQSVTFVSRPRLERRRAVGLALLRQPATHGRVLHGRGAAAAHRGAAARRRRRRRASGRDHRARHPAGAARAARHARGHRRARRARSRSSRRPC